MKVRVRRVGEESVSVPIHTEFIKLEAFLKLANAVPSGGMAKISSRTARFSSTASRAPCAARSSCPATACAFDGAEFTVVCG